MADARKLYFVKYTFMVPVLAEDREEAISISYDYIDNELPNADTRTAEVKYASQLTRGWAVKKPYNRDRFDTRTLGEIAAEIEKKREEEDRIQLKLFE